MSDPATLSAAAIAILIATKAVEKTTEKFTEHTWERVRIFLNSLKSTEPRTAEEIEQIAQSSSQLTQASLNDLVDKVNQSAERSPQIRSDLEEVRISAYKQPEVVTNLTQKAEKIGIIIHQGGSGDYFTGATLNF